MTIKIWDYTRKEYFMTVNVNSILDLFVYDFFLYRACIKLENLKIKEEIYTNDIVEIKDSYNTTWRSIVYYDISTNKSFIDDNPLKDKVLWVNELPKNYIVKKIGNIFENSGLLIHRKYQLN